MHFVRTVHLLSNNEKINICKKTDKELNEIKDHMLKHIKLNNNPVFVDIDNDRYLLWNDQMEKLRKGIDDHIILKLLNRDKMDSQKEINQIVDRLLEVSKKNGKNIDHKREILMLGLKNLRNDKEFKNIINKIKSGKHNYQNLLKKYKDNALGDNNKKKYKEINNLDELEKIEKKEDFFGSLAIEWVLCRILGDWAVTLWDIGLTLFSIGAAIVSSIPGLQAVYGIGFIADFVTLVVFALEIKAHTVEGKYDENGDYYVDTQFSLGNLIFSISDIITTTITFIPVVEVVGGIGKVTSKLIKLLIDFIQFIFKIGKKGSKITKKGSKIVDIAKTGFKIGKKLGLDKAIKEAIDLLVGIAAAEIEDEIVSKLPPEDEKVFQKNVKKEQWKKDMVEKYTNQIMEKLGLKYGDVIINNLDVIDKSIYKTIKNIVNKYIDQQINKARDKGIEIVKEKSKEEIRKKLQEVRQQREN